MSQWSIRHAGPQDIAAVLVLWELAGIERGVSDTQAGVRALLQASHVALLVADGGDEQVPGLAGSLIATWDGWRGNLYRLAVHPERRRRRLARALLSEGERWLRERGAVRLSAIVADDDATARAFWESAGYRRQPSRARFIRLLEEESR